MKTILAADDSAVILLYIEESLKDEGYNVISAKNGMKALELIGNFKGIIDFFIIDIIMSPMDGLSLIQRIRQMEMYKDTPVIVLTSLTDESTIENAKLSGANCWINKPFEMGALLDAIKRLG
jgi:two-component system chemotaxis response regulator CheY